MSYWDQYFVSGRYYERIMLDFLLRAGMVVSLFCFHK